MSSKHLASDRSAALRRLADHLSDTADIERLTTAASEVDQTTTRPPLRRVTSLFGLLRQGAVRRIAA